MSNYLAIKSFKRGLFEPGPVGLQTTDLMISVCPCKMFMQALCFNDHILIDLSTEKDISRCPWGSHCIQGTES